MSLRRWMRLTAANVLYASGLGRWRLERRSENAGVCVLGLHRILSEQEAVGANSLGSMVLREATFVEMLEYVSHNFQVISLEAFLDGVPGGGSKPRCLVTFDDGWKDNYTTAFPWLKKLGIPATIFLATGLMDGTGIFWVEQLKSACRDLARLEQVQQKLASTLNRRSGVIEMEDIVEHLKRMPAAERRCFLESVLPPETAAYEGGQMLTWNEVLEMSRAGIEFGGHTDTHPLLPYEDDAVVERELCVCKQKIERTVGKKARAFAYPNGDWDERVRRLTEKAGYDCAFATQPGWYRPGNDAYTIHRVLLHEGCVTGHDGEFSPAAFNFQLTRWR